ncbi:MAG: hypothetical protein JWR40_2575 [Massilia sp.]|nr:hypothetical protein [Massilia sp.]
MILNRDEKIALNMLLKSFDQIAFETFLADAFLVELSEFSTVVMHMPVIRVAFIKWLDNNPDKLIATLDAFIAEFPAHPACAILNSAVRRCARIAASTTPQNSWQSKLVEGVPVVNRTRLRGFLATICNSQRPTVVVVNGPRGTGRTHSFYLIKHVAVCWHVQLARINLDWLFPHQRNLASIVTILVDELKLSGFIPPSDAGVTTGTLGARYAENFAAALKQQPTGTKNWFVFDSLEMHRLPEVEAFICTLITMKLRHDLDNCIFFLLDAGPNYAFQDPHGLIANDRVGVFLPNEIDTFAGELNALGETQLAATELALRTDAIRSLLQTMPDHQVCAEISKKFAELRDEVNA